MEDVDAAGTNARNKERRRGRKGKRTREEERRGKTKDDNGREDSRRQEYTGTENKTRELTRKEKE